jgi:hypothetical protein
LSIRTEVMTHFPIGMAFESAAAVSIAWLRGGNQRVVLSLLSPSVRA